MPSPGSTAMRSSFMLGCARMPRYGRPRAACDRSRPARAAAYRAGRGRSRTRRGSRARSEEHTSELQSLAYLVCRLLLEKKKKKKKGLRQSITNKVLKRSHFRHARITAQT